MEEFETGTKQKVRHTTEVIKRTSCRVADFAWRLYEVGWIPAIGWVCCWTILYRFSLTSMIEHYDTVHLGKTVPPILRSPSTEITGFVLAVLGSQIVKTYSEHIKVKKEERDTK